MSATFTDESGKRSAYAWPGGYPLFYVCKDGGVLCPACANLPESLTATATDPDWFVTGCDANYEDDSLSCDHCSSPIESAYGPDDDDTDEPEGIPEDAYILSPSGRLGGMTSVSCDGRHLKDFADTADALRFVAERMESEGYFPGIYWLSDHGNHWPIDTDGNEIK